MRHSRSERAGDLKAGNITPPLDWTTTSTRLTLPCSVGGLGLTRYIFKLLDLLRCSCEQEPGLAGRASLLEGIEVDLHLFEFDAGVGKLTIEVAVVVDLTGEPPIIVVNKGVMEQGKIDGWAHHEKAEPCRYRERGFCFAFF